MHICKQASVVEILLRIHFMDAPIVTSPERGPRENRGQKYVTQKLVAATAQVKTKAQWGATVGLVEV
jgi:hypothetical protein